MSGYHELTQAAIEAAALRVVEVTNEWRLTRESAAAEEMLEAIESLQKMLERAGHEFHCGT